MTAIEPVRAAAGAAHRVVERIARRTMTDATLLAETFALLIGARLAVRGLGVYRSIALFERLGAQRFGRRLVVGTEARTVAVARSVAARAGATCVERALLVWTLLRLRERDATLCIGFGVVAERELGQVGGHAWVEVDGAVVDDDAEHVSGFEVITRHGAQSGAL
ncbi:MAG: hypothetical protein NVS3B10_21530 [Polyangiales bacterium]